MAVIAAMCEQGCTVGDGIAILGIALTLGVCVSALIAKL